MTVVHNFIRRTSPDGLKDYFSKKRIQMAGVDWSQDQATVSGNVIQLLDHLSPDDKDRLRLDAERICHMSDELGQAAFLSVVRDQATFKRIDSALERSRWVYLHQFEEFRHAEDIRMSDQYRFGRDWSSYQIHESALLHTDGASLDAFKDSMRSLLGMGDRVKIEFFERVITDEDGNESEVVQVMAYQEGHPDSYLEFDGEDSLVSRIRRPVSEHAIIYSTSEGTLEVVAAKRDRRDLIAKAFTEDLLKQAVDVERLPLRRYDLEPLMSIKEFEWDVEDGIESVQLVMIKLKDLAGEGRVQIDVPAKTNKQLHVYSNEKFGESDPLLTGQFVPTQGRINIRFHPENGSGRSKLLPVKITMPNGCDLRSRTERERLIGEKYLKRWGLLEEVAV